MNERMSERMNAQGQSCLKARLVGMFFILLGIVSFSYPTSG